jgi:hypothetical protein
VPYWRIRRAVSRELGGGRRRFDEVFESFDRAPAATASIAQVRGVFAARALLRSPPRRLCPVGDDDGTRGRSSSRTRNRARRCPSPTD